MQNRSNSIGAMLKERRLQLNMTLEEVGAAVGVAKSTVKKWEDGYIENMRRDKIAALATVLRISPVDIIRGAPSDITDDKMNIHPLPKSRRFPVIGAIACGTPIEAVEEYAETLDFPDEIDADVLLRCRGDSMTPTYHDGDYVFIRRQPTVENGQIAAVYVKDGAEWDATLKKVIMYPEKNMIVLRPLNADYEDMIFTGEECEELEIFGVAVAIYRKV